VSTSELNVHLLLAVVVVVLAVQGVGWVLARLGQPRVIGEILAGILLGPSLLGVVAPNVLAYVFPAPVIGGLQVLAQFGLVLFMFLVGLHLDIAAVRRSRGTVAAVAPAAVAVSFVLAVGVGVLVHPVLAADLDPVAYCLFLGVAMAVTALPVLARLLVDTGLDKRRVGSIALSCSAVNDVVAWCGFAVITAVVGAGVGRGFLGVLASLGAVLLYFAAVLVGVRWLLNRLPAPPIWVALVLALVSSWVAEQLGIHAVIGAFAAGVAMPRRHEWLATLNYRLGPVVTTLLLPVFFAVAGIATRVDQLTSAALLVTVLVVVVAMAGKMLPSTLAARVAGEDWPTSINLGILMNTRGLTELVMLSLGLSSGFINTGTYTVMVLMALVTTLAAAPLLALVGRRTGVLPETEDEDVAAPAGADLGEAPLTGQASDDRGTNAGRTDGSGAS